MENFEAIKKEIEDIISKSPLEFDLNHARWTLECLLKIKPDADEIWQIAAFAHDIERGNLKVDDVAKEKDLTDLDFLRHHEEGGALIISKILERYHVDRKIIEKVKHLVARHEEGGDDDQNLIKDIDSMAFFEYGVPSFLVGSYWQKLDKTIVKKKIEWMYNRISSPELKEKYKKTREKALRDLELI
jgi:hypothetical protein